MRERYLDLFRPDVLLFKPDGLLLPSIDNLLPPIDNLLLPTEGELWLDVSPTLLMAPYIGCLPGHVPPSRGARKKPGMTWLEALLLGPSAIEGAVLGNARGLYRGSSVRRWLVAAEPRLTCRWSG